MNNTPKVNELLAEIRYDLQEIEHTFKCLDRMPDSKEKRSELRSLF